MVVHFVRHGIADDGSSTDDDLRPLSAEGRQKTAQIGRGLRQADCKPSLVASSPLVRAGQTAEILAEELRVEAPVATLPCLAPGGNFAEFMSWLEQQEAASVLVVGHMLDIAEFAQRCLTGRILFSMTFKKAAVCCVEFEEEPAAGRGRLEWLMQPGHLRQLAR
ncbi:MAG: phosphohistidine phosphatase SixA [Lentisphaerae bacterium]|nr:phosphohistidine phosphatase SixA [Lentisphaerota bacterium]